MNHPVKLLALTTQHVRDPGECAAVSELHPVPKGLLFSDRTEIG